MACAAKVTASMRNATASPVARPTAASATIQPANCIMLPGTESSDGHREYIPNVRIIASVILAVLGPAWRPGSGRNTKTPAIRASTRRNPYSTEVGMAGLECIIHDVGPAPSPAPDPRSGLTKTLKTEADEGGGRGPGGPPHLPFSMHFGDRRLACISRQIAEHSD